MIICPNCSYQNDDSMFCEDCGEKLEAIPASNETLDLETTVDKSSYPAPQDHYTPSIPPQSHYSPSITAQETSSDCSDLQLDWDQGKCTNFQENKHAGLHFHLRQKGSSSPLSDVIIQATLPTGESFLSKTLPKLSEAGRKLTINLASQHMQAANHCTVDLLLSYTKDDQRLSFECEVSINILRDESSNDVHTFNITADRAADLSINGLEIANNNAFAKIPDSPSSWQELPLYQSSDEISIQPVETNVQSFESCQLTFMSGEKLQIFTQDQVVLGRSREADLLARTFPAKNHPNYNEEFKRINIETSSLHSTIVFHNNNFIYIDAVNGQASRNGSAVNGQKIHIQHLIQNQDRLHLAPDIDPTKGFALLCHSNDSRDYLYLTRQDAINEAYLILRGSYNFSHAGENIELLKENNGIVAKIKGQKVSLNSENFKRYFKKVQITGH